MKDATAGKIFLEDIESDISKLHKCILLMAIFLIFVFILAAFFHEKELNSLDARMGGIELRMRQQESLTREALGVDHKQRIQAVYDGKHINY